MGEFTTPDLCDEFEDEIAILDPGLISFGGEEKFCGEIVTIKCFEDNSRVREQLALPGDGKVLVVDGGGSLRRALLGDMLAENGVKNGWAGVVINGCARDVEVIESMSLGVLALSAYPLKTEKRGLGDVNVEVKFLGVVFRPGDYLYADENGLIVSSRPLID